MNENGAEFKGMMRFDARVAVYNALEAKGLIRGKEDNPMRLGLCSRTGDVLEPLLKPQWWVNCSSMAARAVAAVRSGDLKIVPEMHEHTWFQYVNASHATTARAMPTHTPLLTVALCYR